MNSDAVPDPNNVNNHGESDGGSVAVFNGSVALSVTVMRVIDGGTIVVKYENGSRETFHLMGINVPQTTLSKVEPRQYGYNDTADAHTFAFGVGKNAKQYTNRKLNRKQVQLMVGPERINHEQRFGYLYTNRTDFGRQLLARGYARVGDRTITKHSEYNDVEANARQRGIGIWSYNNSNHSGQLNDNLVEKYAVSVDYLETMTSVPDSDIMKVSRITCHSTTY